MSKRKSTEPEQFDRVDANTLKRSHRNESSSSSTSGEWLCASTRVPLPGEGPSFPNSRRKSAVLEEVESPLKSDSDCTARAVERTPSPQKQSSSLETTVVDSQQDVFSVHTRSSEDDRYDTSQGRGGSAWGMSVSWLSPKAIMYSLPFVRDPATVTLALPLETLPDESDPETQLIINPVIVATTQQVVAADAAEQ
ncbi:hypothetical protein GCK32_005398 [Trichostrongylus colubriformis]|uniref:Uncharacterized protein n=1 Tax=Trichostrongylus colubriformis TaxID=6319 RepID=A0AAN8FXI0_TRICO